MLKKINWKFRKIHITLIPLAVYINAKWEGWGFDILKISSGLFDYSLLRMTWELPNGAEKKLTFSGDFLFLRTPLLKEFSDIDERMLWSRHISKWDEIKHWTLRLIFR
jgi:hypothetical protein